MSAPSPFPPPASSWIVLQLADAAFPSGGFAHSSGLEAALHLGADVDAEAFVDQVLWQTGRAALPFVSAACADPARLAELDAAFDVTMLSHVANRASRAQGRSLASAASRIFETAEVARVAEHAKIGPAHHAPIFGALAAALGIAPRDASAVFLHGAARGVLSAAVRLGAMGPLEAQRIQADRAPLLAHIHAICTDLDVAEVAQASPLVEIFGALHDRLDGRLFQS